MGKFFKDLPNITSLEEGTLFAVSNAATVKTYKTTYSDIKSSNSAVEARLTTNFNVAHNTVTIIPYNSVLYDIEGSEFNISNNSFEPSTAGIYLVTVSVGVPITSSWVNNDKVLVYILTGSTTSGQVWASAYHAISAPLYDTILQATGIVRITSIPMQIRGAIFAIFSGAPTPDRPLLANWNIYSSTVGYSAMQVNKIG